jgi:hypothetical protein
MCFERRKNMTLVPFKKSEIENIKVERPRLNSIGDMLLRFIESGQECVEVIDHDYKDAVSLRSTVASAIRYYGFLDISVKMRGDRVFLIKEEY